MVKPDRYTWGPLSATQKADIKDAIIMLQEAAAQGHAKAAGYVRTVCSPRHIDLLRLPCEINLSLPPNVSSFTYRYLGGTYNYGWGVQADHKRAFEAYSMGAEAGDSPSMSSVASMYMKGETVTRVRKNSHSVPAALRGCGE